MGLGRQLGRLNEGLHALLSIRALAERVRPGFIEVETVGIEPTNEDA
jgi:hypothetical protein